MLALCVLYGVRNLLWALWKCKDKFFILHLRSWCLWWSWSCGGWCNNTQTNFTCCEVYSEDGVVVTVAACIYWHPELHDWKSAIFEKMSSFYCHNTQLWYSGTPLWRTPLGTNLLAGVPHSGLPVCSGWCSMHLSGCYGCVFCTLAGKAKQGLFILWVTTLICNVKLLTTAAIILLKRWTSVR